MKTKTKILFIMDDDALLAELTGSLDEQADCVVYRSEDTVKKVFDEVPHLIIADEDFSEGDGKNTVVAIKEDKLLKSIPVLFLFKGKKIITKKEDGKISVYAPKDQKDATRHILKQVRGLLLKNYDELDQNPLTHLPGIRSSILHVNKSAHSNKKSYVCSVDLSDLSAYNSVYGDARGDQVITMLGKVINKAVKHYGTEDDFIGHLGGDDFIVITNGRTERAISKAIVENFDATIPSFYDLKNRESPPIMRVKISIIPNDKAENKRLDEIVHISLELKRRMKELPGSCYFEYVSEDTLHEEIDTENGFMKIGTASKFAIIKNKNLDFLEHLLQKKAIGTVFQPIIDLKSKVTVGYEALTRGFSNGHLDSAVHLFMTARDCGRVKELDRICVDCALMSAQTLSPDKKLFINLNHETLIDKKLMKHLFSKIGTVSMRNIVIEVTEQSLTTSAGKMESAVGDLKAQGVSVAIDDVGGGAVSLRDVAKLRPHYIKFDRSLIRQIDSDITKQQIVLSMILFAEGIDATTTAEGIETKEEYHAACISGIKLGQGYYFARPGKAFPTVKI